MPAEILQKLLAISKTSAGGGSSSASGKKTSADLLHELLVGTSTTGKKFTALERFLEAQEEDCSICIESLAASIQQEVSLTKCGHVFHRICIVGWCRAKGGSGAHCPICRTVVSSKDLTARPADFAEKAIEFAARNHAPSSGAAASSGPAASPPAQKPPPKVVETGKLALKILGDPKKKAKKKGGPPAGVVVFSCFLAMLDRVEEHLRGLGFRVAQLTGSVSLSERAAVISSFQEGKVDILCCSLRAVGQGVTLTAGKAVVLLDPWWNLAVVGGESFVRGKLF